MYGVAAFRAVAGFLEVPRDSRTQIERRDPQVFGRRETKPYERVDECERLNRLHRVEIVAVGLVGEVQARPDDRDSSNRRGQVSS